MAESWVQSSQCSPNLLQIFSRTVSSERLFACGHSWFQEFRQISKITPPTRLRSLQITDPLHLHICWVRWCIDFFVPSQLRTCCRLCLHCVGSCLLDPAERGDSASIYTSIVNTYLFYQVCNVHDNCSGDQSTNVDNSWQLQAFLPKTSGNFNGNYIITKSLPNL